MIRGSSPRQSHDIRAFSLFQGKKTLGVVFLPGAGDRADVRVCVRDCRVKRRKLPFPEFVVVVLVRDSLAGFRGCVLKLDSGIIRS